jgi:transposase
LCDIHAELAWRPRVDIQERAAGDREQLRRLIREEADAAQRDRYRAVALAIDGRLTDEIMEMLDRSRGFVQRWVYAYRDRGLDLIATKKPPGKKAKLSGEQCEKLQARLLAGPTEEDNVCEFRGRDIQHLLEHEFGVKYSLNGVYNLLHRLGFSWLAPRPRHRHADPEAQEAFKASAPLLSTTSGKNAPTRRSRSGFKMS